MTLISATGARFEIDKVLMLIRRADTLTGDPKWRKFKGLTWSLGEPLIVRWPDGGITKSKRIIGVLPRQNQPQQGLLA